jgi:hypothetical protein
MACPQLISASQALSVISFAMASLLPSVALAGWGEDAWGAMVWGSAPPVSIPALPDGAMAALAALLLGLSYWLLATRRRRAKHPSLHS